MYKLTGQAFVIRLADGAIIPMDEGNTDYQAYLHHVQQGGEVQPADTPDPTIAIRQQIDGLEHQQMLPRATREFMLLSMQSMATPEQLQANPGYKAVKAFDDQIGTLRAQL
jgi:hypothetical protein